MVKSKVFFCLVVVLGFEGVLQGVERHVLLQERVVHQNELNITTFLDSQRSASSTMLSNNTSGRYIGVGLIGLATTATGIALHATPYSHHAGVIVSTGVGLTACGGYFGQWDRLNRLVSFVREQNASTRGSILHGFQAVENDLVDGCACDEVKIDMP